MVRRSERNTFACRASLIEAASNVCERCACALPAVISLATRKSDERPKLKSSHRGESARTETKKRVEKPKVKPAKRVSLPGTSAKSPESKRKAPLPMRTQAMPESRPLRGQKKTAQESYATDDARQTALAVVSAALEKKALGLEVLDVAGRVDYADFLVLMTGRSDRQVAALAAGIEESLRKVGRRALAVEGLPVANWVLMDFGDVVVHVFQESARSLYDLEGLWMDARRLPIAQEPELH
jgi:ribosome-associated protein